MIIKQVLKAIDYIEDEIPFLTLQQDLVKLTPGQIYYINRLFCFCKPINIQIANDEFTTRMKERWQFSAHIETIDEKTKHFKTLLFMRLK